MVITRRMLGIHGGYRNPEVINLLVLHSMAEFIVDGANIRDAWTFLLNHRLSAHYIVTPSGVIFNCVPEMFMAWHCRGHNTRSIGIEFLVPGVHDYESFTEAIQTPYLTDIQTAAGILLVKQLQQQYESLTIKRHSTLDPDRKVDPGEGFPFTQIIERLE